MRNGYKSPPLIALWLLRFLVDHENAHPLLGDIEEDYQEICSTSGVLRADCWCWMQVILSIPSFFKQSIYWSAAMLSHYLKIVVRSLLKNKGYSFINISGLAVGIACCLLIALWISNELGYDKFHRDSLNMYQVLAQGSNIKNNPSTPAPLAPALKTELPEIQFSTRYGGFGEQLLEHKNKKFYEKRIFAADADFFGVFTFPFLLGDPGTSLKNNSSIVISETVAAKYFGGESPLGKTLTMNNSREYIITGVIKNIPHNSSLQFDILVPFENFIQNMEKQGWKMNWGWYSPNTFIRLHENYVIDDLNQKLTRLFNQHEKDGALTVLPFVERHLVFSNTIQYIYIFATIAFFILVIACINFVNLTTARSSKRAKEICVRKVSGAYRKSIIAQFMGETFIFSATSLVLAVLIIVLALPAFNALVGTNIPLDLFANQYFLPTLLILVLFLTFFAGSYPALILSAFQPVKILKGDLKSGIKGSLLRKGLVVTQFTLSIFMIIGTGIVHTQLSYLKTKDIGYEKEHIVSIAMRGDVEGKYYNLLKGELQNDERILGITGTLAPLPYFSWSSGTSGWEGKDPESEVLTSNNFVDYDFVETMKIEMIEGRDFSREFISDLESGYLINEEMANVMGKESAVGERLTYWDNTGHVIGVMKNFHFQSLANTISPLVLMLAPKKVGTLLVRIQSENIAASLEYIKETWSKVNPDYPFDYRFLDEQFDQKYRSVERMGNLANSFSLFAIFIACLGLFGLASFIAEQRSKEIGIRKVFGASVLKIVSLLSTEFAKLVLLANIIAWPIGYFAMRTWLQNYAYRIDLSVWTFVLSAAIVLAIAMITVSFQSIKAATINPVDSLRNE